MKKIETHMILLFATILVAFMPAQSQNSGVLGEFPKNFQELKSSVRLTGTINASTSFYFVTKINDRRPPFKFNLYGTPTLYINNIKIPIRFTLGTYQNRYQQEFNRIGISPTYKNFTLHLGHSSVSFSPLALNAHNFLGAGFEWNPGNWRLGYVWGRFQRKIQPDSIAFFQDNILPSFRRTGMGFKAGYGTKDNYFDLVVFKGKDLDQTLDEIKSWDLPPPGENAVIAISTHKTFLKDFKFRADIAFSAYTENTTDPEMNPDRWIPEHIPALFLLDRTSTQYLKAIQSGLKYSRKSTSINWKDQKIEIRDLNFELSYDRIDPGYQSMGTYFFRNDLERFSLATGFHTLGNRLTISLPIGYEHNNLLKHQLSTNRRMIGGIQILYKHNQNLTVNLTASNYRSKLYQEIIPDYDSLIVNQVDRNLGLAATYQLERNGQKNKINIRLGFQSGKNITLNNPVRTLSKSYLSGSYHFDYTKWDVSLTPNLGIYYYSYGQGGNFRLIPSLTARKVFLQKKLDVSYNLGIILSNGLLGIRNQARASYKISDKQGLSLQLFYIQNISAFNPFGEFQMELRWWTTL